MRKATHAGSWYSNQQTALSATLSTSLSTQTCPSPSPSVRAIISPHAGYAYSAKTAAHAFSSVELDQIQTVFILGPSHHTYLVGCSITQFDAYDTPFGRIPINKRIVAELKLPPMRKNVDESEHSIELQIPFLKYVMKNREFDLVPILIGDLNDDEMRFAELFKKYLIDETCLFIISSDFCHWGNRFRYTYTPPPSTAPLHTRIRELDHQGMELIQQMDLLGFKQYLTKTGNTICGRNPILILLACLQIIEKEKKVEFVFYDQSEKIVGMDESSVSYAAGVIQIF